MATDATFVTNIDLSNLELRNAKAHILSADPAAVEGKIIYNSTTKQLKYHDGTSWVSAGGAPLANLTGQAAAFGQSASNGSATTAARSDHYHPMPSLPALNTLPVPTGAVAMNGQKITGLAAGTATGDAARYDELNALSGTVTSVQTTANNALPKAGGTMSGAINMGNQKITNLANAVNGDEAVNYNQLIVAVSNAVSGLDVIPSVRVATTANVTLSGLQTIDGVTLVANDRVLVKNQSVGTENMIYVVGSGAWSWLDWGYTPNSFVFVEEGTVNADSGWTLTNNGTISGSTVMNWTQFSGAGQITAGNGLTKTGNTLDVGAGTGISVAADSVAVDTSVVARKYSTTLSTSATSYVVTHNLNTQDINLTVRKLSDQSVAYTSWEATSVNTATVYFATAPAANAYRVTVMG